MQTLSKDWMRISFLLLGGVLILFIVWPLAQTVLSSKPGILWQTLLDREVLSSIAITFYSSLIATGIAFLTGVPLAYLLARSTFPGKRLIEGIIDLPIVVPHSAVGIALLMLFVSMSYLVNAVRDGFASVDPRLEKVARTLGASQWRALWRVSFPLAWRSILSGMILMWARGLSEFGAVIILSYHPTVAPVLLYTRFESYGLDYARPLATILILSCLVVFVGLRMLTGRSR